MCLSSIYISSPNFSILGFFLQWKIIFYDISVKIGFLRYGLQRPNNNIGTEICKYMKLWMCFGKLIWHVSKNFQQKICKSVAMATDWLSICQIWKLQISSQFGLKIDKNDIKTLKSVWICIFEVFQYTSNLQKSFYNSFVNFDIF